MTSASRTHIAPFSRIRRNRRHSLPVIRVISGGRRGEEGHETHRMRRDRGRRLHIPAGPPVKRSRPERGSARPCLQPSAQPRKATNRARSHESPRCDGHAAPHGRPAADTPQRSAGRAMLPIPRQPVVESQSSSVVTGATRLSPAPASGFARRRRRSSVRSAIRP